MIVLRQLRVSALKQLRAIDIHFPPRGSVLIEGSNEAGKSTLFEAIYFALYGAALVGEDARASLDALTPHGATVADAALTVQIGETTLEIQRTLSAARRISHEATLFVRRPGVAPERLHGPRAVNDRILQELGGLDSEALRNSCLMEQQALDRIESLSRIEREEAIANLLGLKRLIAIEGELRPTADDRAQVERLRERLRLAREATARRRDAQTAQATADELAIHLRVAEAQALIADRDAAASRQRDGAQRAARLADEIDQLEAQIGQARQIDGLAQRLDAAAEQYVAAQRACEALAQTDARLAELARLARDELPLAQQAVYDLREREAALATALQARDAALADLRDAREGIRRGQALAAARQQRAETLARLTADAANADATHRQTQATLAEATNAAATARQAEARADESLGAQITARAALAGWVNARDVAAAAARAEADAQTGAQNASEAADRLARRRDASAVQVALAQQGARQAGAPTLAASAAALVLLIIGGALASHSGLAAGGALIVALAALTVAATLAARWRTAAAAERAARAAAAGADRAAYEAIARRDALLVALRASSRRAINLVAGDVDGANPTGGAALTAALTEPDPATLALALRPLGLTPPATLAAGQAALATLDAQGATLRQALQLAQAETRTTELELAHARAADEAAERQRDRAQQGAREAEAPLGANAIAPNSGNAAPDGANITPLGQRASPSDAYRAADDLSPAELAARLAAAEQAHIAAEAALDALAADGDHGNAAGDGRSGAIGDGLSGAIRSSAVRAGDARDLTALAAQRGAAQAALKQLRLALNEREPLTATRAEHAQQARGALVALHAALAATHHAALTAQVSFGDHTAMADDAALSNDSSPTNAATSPASALARLGAWRQKLESVVATAQAMYDVSALHARLGASRAEHKALATQIADAQVAYAAHIAQIRQMFAEQGIVCVGDEPLAELATRWPALGALAAATQLETPTADPTSTTPLAQSKRPSPPIVPLPVGEGQPSAAGASAVWGPSPDDLRQAYASARSRADEARGAATQAATRLRDHAGTPEPAPVAAHVGATRAADESLATEPRTDGANAPARAVAPTVDGVLATPDTLDEAGDDALDEETCRARLASAERRLLRRELAARMAREVRARIARRVLPETEAHMRALLPELTAGRYRDVELLREDGPGGQGARGAGGADLRIRVWDQVAGRYVAKGLFSGGARDQVSLALRLAFALATLPKELGAIPGFIFLDEPLSAFDAERADALVRLLTQGVIARQFPQVFLISHSQSIDPQAFDYRVRMAAGRIVETNLPSA